ncbi:hypothetical protein NDU88_003102 [Pleurodeles waltl]|uniref:Uncharacterized protein n=1 Tax=Pleurodeles waltl TaxID=8319 RepID=A0AAV7PDQ7_PLEWA|nr:hypothetical protein NDU88_003102 [Pleurodeles waltl]
MPVEPDKLRLAQGFPLDGAQQFRAQCAILSGDKPLQNTTIRGLERLLGANLPLFYGSHERKNARAWPQGSGGEKRLLVFVNEEPCCLIQTRTARHLPIMRCTATCRSLNTDLCVASELPSRAVSWVRFCRLSKQLERSRAGNHHDAQCALENTALPPSGALEHRSTCRAAEP